MFLALAPGVSLALTPGVFLARTPGVSLALTPGVSMGRGEKRLFRVGVGHAVAQQSQEHGKDGGDNS